MGKHKEAIESLFRIYNKEGILVDFILNTPQIMIDQAMDAWPRNTILKPRQKGCSVYIMARYLIDCMNEHTIAVMLAHDKDHTERLLRKAQEFLQNMKGPKPKTSRANENEIYFDRTQSSFYIGTAGSKNFGRSATITRLHMSELAFWKNPKDIRTGLLQAVPVTGEVVEETTANGYGTWYQKYYYRLGGIPNSRVKPIFFNWLIDDEYSSITPMVSPLTDEEVGIMQEFGATREQIQWRREKLEEMDFDLPLFKQEYPLTIDEAFKFTGGSLFSELILEETEDWVPFLDGHVLRGHPNPDYHYVLGADSSGGTGNDEASISVICLETLEQVFEYGNNRMASPKFAPVVEEIGKLFNTAYIIPEANSHGLSTIAILKETYPTGRIFRRSVSARLTQSQNVISSYTYGWETTRRTKAYSIGVTQKLFSGGMKIHSTECASQLRAFTEDAETGEIVNSGDHDDRGMSFMLACVGIQRLIRENSWNIEPEKEKTLREKVLEARERINKKAWRNDQGVFVLPFKDMFPVKKGKRNVHIQ